MRGLGKLRGVGGWHAPRPWIPASAGMEGGGGWVGLMWLVVGTPRPASPLDSVRHNRCESFAGMAVGEVSVPKAGAGRAFAEKTVLGKVPAPALPLSLWPAYAKASR